MCMFILKTPNTNLELKKLLAKELAKRQLISTKYSTTEYLLEAFLLKKYNLSLLQACIAILSDAKYRTNYQGEIIITIPDKKLNKIARIITFGTGKLLGSNILKNALSLTQ